MRTYPGSLQRCWKDHRPSGAEDPGVAVGPEEDAGIEEAPGAGVVSGVGPGMLSGPDVDVAPAGAPGAELD